MSGAVTAAVIGGAAYGLGATAVTAAAIGIGGGMLVNQAQQGQAAQKAQQQGLEMQRQAQAQATQAAQAQAKAADQAMNRANRKSPNMSTIGGAGGVSGGNAPSGTMLTGPQGVDTQQMTLGKSTLLGG